MSFGLMQMIPIDAWEGKVEDVELLKRCKKVIRKVVPDADVILYGSRARGDADEDSDYDILILTNGPISMPLKERFYDHTLDLELETGVVLTLIAYDRQQWDTPLYRAMPFHKNVDREGVVV